MVDVRSILKLLRSWGGVPVLALCALMAWPGAAASVVAVSPVAWAADVNFDEAADFFDVVDAQRLGAASGVSDRDAGRFALEIVRLVDAARDGRTIADQRGPAPTRFAAGAPPTSPTSGPQTAPRSLEGSVEIVGYGSAGAASRPSDERIVRPGAVRGVRARGPPARA